MNNPSTELVTWTNLCLSLGFLYGLIVSWFVYKIDKQFEKTFLQD